MGMNNLPTHYCETCNVDHMEQAGYKDLKKMCFQCCVDHRLQHVTHTFVVIMPLQLFTQQMKRFEHSERTVSIAIGLLQEYLALN